MKSNLFLLRSQRSSSWGSEIALRLSEFVLKHNSCITVEDNSLPSTLCSLSGYPQVTSVQSRRSHGPIACHGDRDRRQFTIVDISRQGRLKSWDPYVAAAELAKS